MDRMLTNSERSKFTLIKDFELLDIFPYSIALLLLLGEVYILATFIAISRNMH